MNFFLIILVVMFSPVYSNNNDTLIVKKLETKDLWKMSLFPTLNMASAGQLHNNKPLKAIILSGMKMHWLNEFKIAHEAMNLSNRSRAFWWFLLLYFYTIIDASIDSEFQSFPEENKQLKESQ